MARNPNKRVNAASGWRLNQRPLSPVLFWTSMGLTGACVLAVAWLVVDSVPVKQFGIGPRVLLIVMLAIFAIASLASTEVIPWSSRSWTDWRRPKVLGTIVYLLLGAAGFLAGVANVFDPPASEATQRAIRKQVGEIAKDTDAIAAGQKAIGEAVGVGQASLVRRSIDRVWGEPGCKVTYRLRLNDRSLVMTSLADAAGMAAFREEYTIVRDDDRPGPGGERLSVMETNEVGGPHDGFGVTFTYGGNGTSAWLEWKHRSGEINAVRLVPCGTAPA